MKPKEMRTWFPRTAAFGNIADARIGLEPLDYMGHTDKIMDGRENGRGRARSRKREQSTYLRVLFLDWY